MEFGFSGRTVEATYFFGEFKPRAKLMPDVGYRIPPA